MMFNECTPICRVINSMRCIFTTNSRLALIVERLAMTTWCRLLLLCTVLPTFLTACGTKDREFPGHTRDQVWKAMVQAADDPRYADWVVLENKVWRDDAQSRIEILRDLVRDVMVPGQDPKREEAEWRFSAELVNSNPPSVEFSTSTITVPAHFWLQARHYLDEVDRRLAGMPIETKSKILSYSSDHSNTAPEVSKGLPVVSTSESDARLPPEIPMSSAVSMAATSATTGAVQSSSMPQSQPLEQPAAVVEGAPSTQSQPLEQPAKVVEAAPSTPPQPLEQPAAVVDGEPTPVTEVDESTHSAMSKSTMDPSTDVEADPTQDQPSHAGAVESESSVLTPVVVPVSEKDLQVAQSEGIPETMTPAPEAIPAPEPVAQEAERPAPEPVEQINVKPAIVAQPAVVASAQKIEKPKSNLVRGPNPDTGTEKELGVGAEKVDTSSPHSTSASTSETATASTFESVNNSTAEPAVVVPSAMVSEEVGQIVDEHNSTSTGGSENSSSGEGDPSLEAEPTPIVDSEPEINSQPERSPISKPAAEPVAQPEVQPAAEPEPESAPEPEVQPAAEPELAPAPEPEVQPTAEPELAPAPEPEVQPTAEPEPEPASEPVVQPTAEPEPEPASEPVVQPAAEPEPEPAPEPVAQPAPVRKTKLQPTPAPVPEPVEPSPFEPPPEP